MWVPVTTSVIVFLAFTLNCIIQNSPRARITFFPSISELPFVLFRFLLFDHLFPMQHSWERHQTRRKIFTSGTYQLSTSLSSFKRVEIVFHIPCLMWNEKYFRLSQDTLVNWCIHLQSVILWRWRLAGSFFGEIFLRNWLSLLDLSTILPIFLLPLSPLMRKFMSVIKTLAVAIRLVPKAANHGGGEWRVVPTHDINTHMLVCFEIVPYSISTMGACGTYTFTAGVLQSSGQDLGCSSSQCLSLSLGTKHMELPLFLLSQRVAVAHLEEPRRRVWAEWTN